MVYTHQQTAKIPLSRSMYTMLTKDIKLPTFVLKSYSHYYPLIVRMLSTDDNVQKSIQISAIIKENEFKQCENINVLKRINLEDLQRGSKRKYDSDDSSSSNRITIDFNKLRPIE